MRLLILIMLLVVDPVKDVNKIARTNELKKEAQEALKAENFEVAIAKYHFLLDSMGVQDDAINLNLAHAYYQNQDTATALNTYSSLMESPNNIIASKAFHQMGVIKNKQKKQQEALKDFKNALRKDPTNEKARYNYEMLKKLLDEQKKQEQQQKQQDQKDQKKDQKDKEKEQEQQQDQQNQENQENQENKDQKDQQQKDKNKEGEEKDQEEKSDQQEEQDKKEEEKKDEGKPEEQDEQNKEQKDNLNLPPDKLEDLKISKEKAQMILEAMKNQEVQYLQQKKKKTDKRPPSGKPDW